MTIRSILLATVAVGFALAAPFTATAQDAIGSGSSFVAPLMERWVDLAKDYAGVTIQYKTDGSANGQNKVLAREVDFAITDSPMSVDALAGGQMVQFPIAIGAVVCVVNMPGIVSGQLKLDGTLLAAIYGGKIKNWNDPAITSVNPGVKLPDLPIRPVWQADATGPTYAFTQYLLAANADWREKYGSVIKKRWAVGSSVASNPAMFEAMQTLPGSIGYLSYGLAMSNNLVMVQLKNSAGNFVAADPEEFANSLADVKWAEAPNLVVNLVNRPGAQSWPILAPIYVQMPADPKNIKRSEATRKFFDFATSRKGRGAVRGSNLVLLPEPTQAIVQAIWAKING